MIVAKKKIIVIASLFVFVFFVRIPIPMKKHIDAHVDSYEYLLKSKRSIYFYPALQDEVLINNKKRDIRLEILNSCAYDAKYLERIYCQFFWIWGKTIDFNESIFFGIWFRSSDLYMILKEDRVSFSIDNTNRNSTFRHYFMWDNIDDDTYYYGVRMLLPLPDTLYLTIWGDQKIYFDNETLLPLSDEETQGVKVEELSSKKSEIQKVFLGEVSFVRTDSIVKEKPSKIENTIMLKDLHYY